MFFFTTSLLLVVLSHHGVIPSDVGLHTTEMIENHGYVAETYEVTTEDGYILTIHRIPHGINNDGTTQKTVVFLMHGLSSSSADWVVMGPDLSLGYLLADAGYDVWLGNSRGNAYSRNHTTLDVVADAEEFFDFSWHEIGYYDAAAIIDYILEVTKEESVHYIGVSQGSTTFLALASSRPEYNQKIKLATLLAPPSFMEHEPNTVLIEIAGNLDQLEVLLKNLSIYEMPFTDEFRQWGIENCGEPANYETCKTILGLIGANLDETQIDLSMIQVIVSNTPSNTGIKPFLHYGQLIKNGGFSLYDYGSEKNLDLYGSEVPPPYNLSAISAPVAIYYAQNDGIVGPEDVLNLKSKLPNVANFYLVPYDPYLHCDFMYAQDNIELLYTEVMSVMEKY